MKEEAKKSMANTIFGKPCIKKNKDVGYATNENNAHAITPQHRCTRKISDFYEDEASGLEIIKENLDVEILECDRQNSGNPKNEKLEMVPFRVLSQNQNHQ
jgi:hypothetical protein